MHASHDRKLTLFWGTPAENHTLQGHINVPGDWHFEIPKAQKTFVQCLPLFTDGETKAQEGEEFALYWWSGGV